MAGTSFQEARLVGGPVARADVSSLAGPVPPRRDAASRGNSSFDCLKQRDGSGSMSAITTGFSPLVEDHPKPDSRRTHKLGRPDLGTLAADALQPNVLVRWAFYISIFTIPFTQFYLPGTGHRIGVTRLVQALILCAVLSQP